MTERTNSAVSQPDLIGLGVHKSRGLLYQATLPPNGNVSNEGSDDGPVTVGDAVSVLMNGYPLRYDCTRGINESLSQVLVEFDYEYVASIDSAIVTNAIFDIDALPIALPSMEWGLLWTVASNLGLHGCKILSNWTESVKGGDSSMGYHVVSLLSRPIDMIDPTTSSCQYIIPSSNSVCYPMRGAMIALHTNGNGVNVSDEVVADIRRLIRDNLDLQRSLTGFVNRTLFLGSRAEYAKANPTVYGKQARASTGLLTAVFASIAGIAILLVGSAYFLRFGHGRKADSNKKCESLSANVGDVESPTLHDVCAARSEPGDNGSMADRSTTSIAVKSIGSSTTILVSNRLAEKASPDGISIISTASTDDSAESEGAVRERPLTPTRDTYTPTSKILENVTARTLDLPSSAVLPPDLPPLAPNPSSSKASAAVAAALSNKTRRRRKKKKRKVAKVTRVSSRENVQGMETIAEAEEVDAVEDDDDDGSEYSWSTSETDGSHSRDPSPARLDAVADRDGRPSGARDVDEDPDALAVTPHSDLVRFPRPPQSPSPRHGLVGGHEC